MFDKFLEIDSNQDLFVLLILTLQKKFNEEYYNIIFIFINSILYFHK